MQTGGIVTDICRNRHGGNELSELANLRINNRKLNLRERIYVHLLKRGPQTCEAAALALEMRISTASARFCELKKLGWIVPTGEWQTTTSGSYAAEYRAVGNAK